MRLDRIPPPSRGVHGLRSSVARSFVASPGTQRAGYLGRPWPASLCGWLRPNTLGILPRACARPLACACRVYQLSRASAVLPFGKLLFSALALAQLRAAAKLHNALFCAMAAPLFARNDRSARTASAGSLAAKPALCKMAAARFVEVRAIARGLGLPTSAGFSPRACSVNALA